MSILEFIQELATPVMSIVALLVSLFKKNKTKQVKTMDEIVEDGKVKMQKYVEKQCKKNNIDLEKDS